MHIRATHLQALAYALGDYTECFDITYFDQTTYEQSEGVQFDAMPGYVYSFGSIALGGEAHGGWVIAVYEKGTDGQLDTYKGSIGVRP